MKITIPKGKYILAVSGGVDSMVLLDLLAKHDVVVAHFNHGIRGDSAEDEELVKQAAKKLNLPLEVGRAKLGPKASEDQARRARYAFLEKTREKYHAKAIITAHHRDDMIETALINTLRGTKRRGLTALADNPKILRPLLNYSKTEIIDFARQNKLAWREDSTNQDERYLRNFLRKKIESIPKAKQMEFAAHLDKTSVLNRQIDQEIAIISQLLIKKNQMERQGFTKLPAEISREVTQYWLRDSGVAQTDKKLTDRAMTFIKTGKPGAKLPINKTIELRNTAKLTELWKA